MESLKQIIRTPTYGKGKIFALFIQFVIILSIVSFSIETLPDLSEETINMLVYIELITVIIFTVEYIFRIYAAENKSKFIFSFFGLIDLLAILPFYITSGIDLRAIRALRLLRIFRIFKLMRYSKATNRFFRAFTIVKEELILFSFVAIILLFLSAVGIYYFENQAQPERFKSVFHCLWWAVITLTTVGYGDLYPITIGGKIFTFFVLMLGLGVIAVPTGLIASGLSQARREEEKNK